MMSSSIKGKNLTHPTHVFYKLFYKLSQISFMNKFCPSISIIVSSAHFWFE